MSQLMNQAAVTKQFGAITEGLQLHMQALNLSVDVLARLSAEARDADARDDVAEMQRDMERMMANNADNHAELRDQLEAVEAGQREEAHKLVARPYTF